MNQEELLLSLLRIREAYRKCGYASSNVEWNVQEENGVRIYSIKGTSQNPGRLGWWSLLRDIISDVRFIPRRSGELKSWHPRGFLACGEALVNEICRELEKHQPIYLEGHSLGGATALLAGAILLRRGYRIQRIVTFGAPRVGKSPFFDRTTLFAYKNGWDIVTTVPFGFAHPTALTRIGKGKRSPLANHALEDYEDTVAQFVFPEAVDDAREHDKL